MKWLSEGGADSEREDIQSLIKESPAHFLEILLVETEVDAEHFSRSWEALSNHSARLDYLAALLITRLEIMHSRRYAFANAEQYERACMLKHRVQKILTAHWQGRDPIEIIEGKWQELNRWMDTMKAIEDELKQLVSRVQGIPGHRELKTVKAALAKFVSKLPGEMVKLQHELPTDAVESGRLISDLADYAILRHSPDAELVTRLRLFAPIYALVFPRRWDESHFLLQSAQSNLARVQELLALHDKHTEELRLADEHYRLGEIDDARRQLAGLGVLRFPDVNYEIVRHKVCWADGMRRQLRGVRGAKACAIAHSILRQIPGLPPSSQLHDEVTTAIQSYKRRLCSLAIALWMLFGLIVFLTMHARQGHYQTQSAGSLPLELKDTSSKEGLTTSAAGASKVSR